MPKRDTLKRGDVVEVLWDDHCTTGGWKYDADVNHTLVSIRSVGMFHGQTKDTITIMQSTDSQDPPKASDHLTIGKGTMKSVRKIA